MTRAKFLVLLWRELNFFNISARCCRSPILPTDSIRRFLSHVTRSVTQRVTEIQRELPHLGPRQPGSQLAGVETVQEEVLRSSSHNLLIVKNRESRRSSVLSLSGEDHGVASVAGVTRTRGVEETPNMVTGKHAVKGVNTRHVSTNSSHELDYEFYYHVSLLLWSGARRWGCGC